MLENQKETSVSQRVWRTAEAGLADSVSARPYSHPIPELIKVLAM